MSSTRPTVIISLAGVLIASLTGVFYASPSASPGASQGASPGASRDGAFQGVSRGGAPAVRPSDAQTQTATIKQYCAGCHNDRAKAAGVSFEGLTPESIGPHADVFEKAVRKLRGRVMPPPGARQPEG